MNPTNGWRAGTSANLPTCAGWRSAASIWVQAISTRRLRRKVGTRQQVIIDEVGTGPGGAARTGPGTFAAKGRSRGDAPQIDGAVLVSSRRPLRVGEIATVKIERADAYDLHGTAVGF